MTHYFIIELEAMKNCNLNHERYTTMYPADSLVSLNNFILRMSKSYLVSNKFERVFVKVWKWENEKAAYMFQGVIYDNDIETIYI